jgi:hypothetical protein
MAAERGFPPRSAQYRDLMLNSRLYRSYQRFENKKNTQIFEFFSGAAAHISSQFESLHSARKFLVHVAYVRVTRGFDPADITEEQFNGELLALTKRDTLCFYTGQVLVFRQNAEESKASLYL